MDISNLSLDETISGDTKSSVSRNKSDRRQCSREQRSRNANRSDCRGDIPQPIGSRRGDGAWTYDLYMNSTSSQRAAYLSSIAIPTKLTISNLALHVTDADIEELFSEFGTVTSLCVTRDDSGKSLGTAEVVFSRRPDASKAKIRYNNFPLVGRPMCIRMPPAITTDYDPRTILQCSATHQGYSQTEDNGPARHRRRHDAGPNHRSKHFGRSQNKDGVERRKESRSSIRKRKQDGRPKRSKYYKLPPTAEQLDAELDAIVAMSRVTISTQP